MTAPRRRCACRHGYADHHDTGHGGTGCMGRRGTCRCAAYRPAARGARRRWLLVAAAGILLALFGCAKPAGPQIVRIVEPIEVKVPVLVKAAPPVELLEPVRPPLPLFVAPADPAASSALTPEGERLLRALLNDLLARLAAWQAWATAPLELPDVGVR